MMEAFVQFTVAFVWLELLVHGGRGGGKGESTVPGSGQLELAAVPAQSRAAIASASRAIVCESHRSWRLQDCIPILSKQKMPPERVLFVLYFRKVVMH